MKQVATMVMGATLLAGATARAAIISNGDFEQAAGAATATFTGWQELVGATPTDVASAVTGTSAINGTSAQMQAVSTGNGDLKQSISNGPSAYRVEFDFVVYTTRPRAGYTTNFLQLYVRHHATNGQAQIRVSRPNLAGGQATDPADILVYTGTADSVVLDDAVSVTTDLSNLKVNHMTIDMTYGSASSYTISVRNADGVTVKSNAITSFTGSTPGASSKLDNLTFNRSYLSYHASYTTTAIVDNVSVTVPEPGSAATMSVGLMGAAGLLGRRRRR